MTNNRIPWIDVAKGIAIILMVLGHSSLPDITQHWIYAFHMPLFFILSGLTSNMSEITGGYGILLFTRRKFVTLGRSFLGYSMVCLGIIYSFHLASLTWWRGWGDFALWFVPVLFVALVIARMVLMANGWFKWSFIFVLPIVSGIMRYYGIVLPWSMSTAPLAAFFILLGSLAKGHTDLFISKKWWHLTISLLVTLAISHYWHLGMSHNQCLPLVPIIVGAIAGTIFICCVSLLIDKHITWFSRVLQTIGRETFGILAFSQVIIMTINKYLNVNVAVKYAMLVIILMAMTSVKNFFVARYHRLNAKKS